MGIPWSRRHPLIGSQPQAFDLITHTRQAQYAARLAQQLLQVGFLMKPVIGTMFMPMMDG